MFTQDLRNGSGGTAGNDFDVIKIMRDGGDNECNGYKGALCLLIIMW